MRERRLILDGSICAGDFIDGVETVQQLQERSDEREPCRFFPSECPALAADSTACIPRAASAVAEYTVKLRTSVADELVDFEREVTMGNGFFDPTIEDPSNRTTDRKEVTERVGKWAERILGIQSIDASTLNHEYKVSAESSKVEQYSVLKTSTHDPENNTWVHACGTVITAAEVRHSLHLRSMPHAGSGRVKLEIVPYCSSCEQKPDANGSIWYEEDEDAREIAQLKAMREHKK